MLPRWMCSCAGQLLVRSPCTPDVRPGDSVSPQGGNLEAGTGELYH